MPIIVIGASRGGLEAIKRILTAIPQDFPAPILVAMHIGAFDSHLPSLLAMHCPLEVRYARDGDVIAPGIVLVAPPNQHLVVDGAVLRLIKGAKENNSRPAIDPLFRSAAISHRDAVIGVILTGDLDDGTIGLKAVKACGGVALVQDPQDAVAPSMPSSALRYVDVDACLPLALLAERMVTLAQRTDLFGRRSYQPTEAMILENKLSLKGTMASISDLDSIGPRSVLTCPECHGVLWEMDQVPLRFRCHTGHTFTERTYQSGQDTFIEESLWAAVRALHEKQSLMERLREDAFRHGRTEAGIEHGLVAEQAHAHSNALIELLKRQP